MESRKTSALRTFIEYLGRGAVPVDGTYWTESVTPPYLPANRKAAESRRFNDAARVSSLPHDRCAPAARGM
jgi:hypothetical protein